MKVILLTSIVIDFLVQQPVVNSVTGTTKFSGIFIRNQMHRPPLSLRRKKDGAKPNHGFEPYWSDNEWVFSSHVTTARGQTVRCTPMLCHKMYSRYGEVCARNKDFTYKTFPSYCEMQNADCTEEKNLKWLIAYRGKCSDLKTFPTQRAPLATRAEEYIKKFNDSLSTRPTLNLSTTTPRGGQGHIQDYFDQYAKEQGKDFDPTFGFEPYWVDGDWVFMEKKLKPNATTTRQPTLVCGDECPHIYRNVKHVCGRRLDKLNLRGCQGRGCKGDVIDDITEGFRTFATHCDFLNQQCRSTFHYKWIFIHSGKCVSRMGDYLKYIKNGRQLLERVPQYYTELAKARESHSLPPIDFT